MFKGESLSDLIKDNILHDKQSKHKTFADKAKLTKELWGARGIILSFVKKCCVGK